MVFRERTYSVLIVSSAQKLNDALSRLLPESDFYPIHFAANAAAARRALLDRTYDFVIINTPLPDHFGTKLAMDICTNRGTVVLMLVRSETHEQVKSKVTDHGVFTLSKPTSSQLLLQALDWMAAARERLRGLEQKTATVEEKMEEIRLVNRAKWLLIEHLKMPEADAHRYIEKQAMDRSVTKREIALGVIKTYS